MIGNPDETLDNPDYAARWLRGACSSGDPLHHALTTVLNDREREAARRPRAEIPELPYPGGTSQADHYRAAADRLQDGYAVGGSNMTATVIKLLRNAAEALDGTRVDR